MFFLRSQFTRIDFTFIYAGLSWDVLNAAVIGATSDPDGEGADVAEEAVISPFDIAPEDEVTLNLDSAIFVYVNGNRLKTTNG